MSDQTPANTANAGDNNTDGSQPAAAGEPKAFEAITSQEDLDKVISTRLGRERQKFSDYDELKAKAAKHDEAERAALSAQERLQKDLEAANARASAAEASQLRASVAAAKGVPESLITGATKEELEASAQALLDFRGVRNPSSSAAGDLNSNTTGIATSTADQFAQLLEGKL